MSTPKLVFDMDGTIAEGKYINFPKLNTVVEITQAYMNLGPYDLYTKEVWNQLVKKYDVYIATWRSYPSAAQDIETWLIDCGMNQPRGIICGEQFMPPGAAIDWKVDIVKALNPVGFFDDHPGIIKKVLQEWDMHHTLPGLTYKMYNPEWDGPVAPEGAISSWKQIGDQLL